MPSDALTRLRETLERAKQQAPEGPGLMPQTKVPQDPKPPPVPWCDTDAEPEEEIP